MTTKSLGVTQWKIFSSRDQFLQRVNSWIHFYLSALQHTALRLIKQTVFCLSIMPTLGRSCNPFYCFDNAGIVHCLTHVPFPFRKHFKMTFLDEYQTAYISNMQKLRFYIGKWNWYDKCIGWLLFFVTDNTMYKW